MRRFGLFGLFALGVALVAGASPAAAAAGLSVTPITWNVVGLDSNDVNAGPNVFPVGARICNSGTDPATGVAAAFAWTSANAAIDVGGPATVAVGALAVGACRDLYWPVTVVRAGSSYGQARSYTISATSAEGAAAATPSPREVFVEQLISQNRNAVNTISGPTSVLVGDTVTFTVDANTATNGYEQLESFLTLPSSMFQLLSTSVYYGAPAGATNDAMYADACGWDNDPLSATYRSCIGPANFTGGKAGGDLAASYTVRVVGAGTAALSAAIYDMSGSSYHYNSDFGTAPNLLMVTASEPAPSTTTTTTTAVVGGAATTTTTTEAPGAVASTATAGAAGAGGAGAGAASSGLATTGQNGSVPLAMLGLALLAIGSLAVGGLRVVPPPRAATPLELRVHELRAALYGHEDDPAAAQAWSLLDALDELVSEL